MNTIRCINGGDVWRLFPEAPTSLIQFVPTATALYAWEIESVPACLLGLTPIPDLPNTGYIWGWNTPLVQKHKIGYARTVKYLVKEIGLTMYPILLGHCTETKRKWVESFGGEIYTQTDSMLNFLVKAPQ